MSAEPISADAQAETRDLVRAILAEVRRSQPDENEQLAALRDSTIRDLLQSSDILCVQRGLNAAAQVESHRRELHVMDLEFTKGVLESFVTFKLLHMRLGGESEVSGSTPEQASAMISQFMSEQREKDRAAERAPSEAVEQPAVEAAG